MSRWETKTDGKYPAVANHSMHLGRLLGGSDTWNEVYPRKLSEWDIELVGVELLDRAWNHSREHHMRFDSFGIVGAIEAGKRHTEGST